MQSYIIRSLQKGSNWRKLLGALRMVEDRGGELRLLLA